MTIQLSLSRFLPTTVVLLATLSAGSAFSSTIATSTFDTSAGGWTVGDAGSSAPQENPTYHATGDNPGGCISTTDDYSTGCLFCASAIPG